MDSLNGRSLQLVRLDAVTNVPNLGNIGPTLSKGDGKGGTLKELLRVDGGVYAKGSSSSGPFAGKEYEIFIPDVNIKIMQFA